MFECAGRESNAIGHEDRLALRALESSIEDMKKQRLLDFRSIQETIQSQSSQLAIARQDMESSIEDMNKQRLEEVRSIQETIQSQSSQLAIARQDIDSMKQRVEACARQLPTAPDEANQKAVTDQSQLESSVLKPSSVEELPNKDGEVENIISLFDTTVEKVASLQRQVDLCFSDARTSLSRLDSLEKRFTDAEKKLGGRLQPGDQQSHDAVPDEGNGDGLKPGVPHQRSNDADGQEVRVSEKGAESNEQIDHKQVEDSDRGENGSDLPQQADKDIEVSLSAKQLTELDEESATHYFFQESMWDSCAFIGFSALSVPDEIMVAIGALSNAGIQILFCLIIYANMASDPILEDNMITGAKHWRGRIGHDVQYADSLTKVSLVSQVCAGNSGLHLSASQNSLFGDLDAYLNPSSLTFNFLDGFVLCNLALLTFFWAMFADMLANLEFCLAIWTQHRGHPCIKRDSNDQLKIVAVSVWQVSVATVVSVLPRLFVEVVLFYAGSLFLVYTPSLGDLVLNAAALVFILDIDELSFSILVPHRVKVLLSQVESIEGSPKLGILRSCQVDVFVASCLLLSLLGLVLTNILFLQPFHDNVKTTHEWLCKGDTEFVYTINKASGVATYAASKPYQDDVDATLVESAVLDIAFAPGSKPGSDTVGGKRRLADESRGSGKAIAAEEKPDYSQIVSLFIGDTAFAATQLQCIDHLELEWVKLYYNETSTHAIMLSYMQDLTGNKSLTSCLDVPFELCLEQNSARTICPIRCGCTMTYYGVAIEHHWWYHQMKQRDPSFLARLPKTGSSAFATAAHGCPTTCDASWTRGYFEGEGDVETAATRDATGHNYAVCYDLPPSLLLNMTSWHAYAHSLGLLVGQLYGVTTGQLAKSSLLQKGCKAVNPDEGGGLLYAIGVCNAGLGSLGRTPRPWCPYSCNCFWRGLQDRSECPKPCHSTLNDKPGMPDGFGSWLISAPPIMECIRDQMPHNKLMPQMSCQELSNVDTRGCRDLDMENFAAWLGERDCPREFASSCWEKLFMLRDEHYGYTGELLNCERFENLKPTLKEGEECVEEAVKRISFHYCGEKGQQQQKQQQYNNDKEGGG